MKKLLFVFLLGTFAACGGGNGESKTDSISTTTNSTTTEGTSGTTGTTGTSGTMSTGDTTTMHSDTSRGH